jgi:hypothetical protein
MGRLVDDMAVRRRTDVKGFPRFFRHVDGFSDDTMYIRCDTATRSTLVSDTTTHCYPLDKCLGYVRAGSWEELTPAQAGRLKRAARKKSGVRTPRQNGSA